MESRGLALSRAGLGRRETQNEMAARLATMKARQPRNFLRPSPFGGGRDDGNGLSGLALFGTAAKRNQQADQERVQFRVSAEEHWGFRLH